MVHSLCMVNSLRVGIDTEETASAVRLDSPGNGGCRALMLAFLLPSTRLRRRSTGRCGYRDIPPSHFCHLPLTSFDFGPRLEKKHNVPHLLLKFLRPPIKHGTLRLPFFSALLRSLEILQ